LFNHLGLKYDSVFDSEVLPWRYFEDFVFVYWVQVEVLHWQIGLTVELSIALGKELAVDVVSDHGSLDVLVAQ